MRTVASNLCTIILQNKIQHRNLSIVVQTEKQILLSKLQLNSLHTYRIRTLIMLTAESIQHKI